MTDKKPPHESYYGKNALQAAAQSLVGNGLMSVGVAYMARNIIQDAPMFEGMEDNVKSNLELAASTLPMAAAAGFSVLDAIQANNTKSQFERLNHENDELYDEIENLHSDITELKESAEELKEDKIALQEALDNRITESSHEGKVEEAEKNRALA